LIGTHTPLILIVIGEPTEKNRSDACFSAIRLNMRSRDIGRFLRQIRGARIKREIVAWHTAKRMKRGRIYGLTAGAS